MDTPAPTRTRRAAIAVAALLATSALTTGTGAGAAPVSATDTGSAPAGQRLTWKPCSGEDRKDFECSTMRAPLDYDRPDGRSISVALIRHRAEGGSTTPGTLFWNACGPGGAPTEALPGTYALFPAEVRRDFDVVSMDPRGVGRSTPLRCFDRFADAAAVLSGVAPGFPVTRAEVRSSVAAYSAFDRACAKNGGPIQRHMSTANVARDMNLLREVLGLSTLDYYGPSYGTYLGATYLNLFPERVGHIILDGNVPPQEWNDAREGKRHNTFIRIGSPQGALVGLRMMLSECGKVSARRCAFSAGSPRATERKYRTLLKRLRSEPVSVSKVPFSYALTASTVSSLLLFQNRNQLGPGWKELTALMQTMWERTTDPSAPVPASVRRVVKKLLSPPKTKGYPVQSQEGISGVLCSESPNPSGPASYLRQGRRVDGDTPYGLGLTWSWLAQPCAEWKARDTDAYAGPWDVPTPPILVIGTLGDANTAYTGSLRMVEQLANARLLTETGGGHTALLNKSACIDAYVVDYLRNGTLPPEGTVCDQDRKPF